MPKEEELKKRLIEARKLPPEQRVKVMKEIVVELKKLEEERKSQIEAALELETQAVKEVERLRKIVPEAKEIPIEDLFAKPALEEMVEETPDVPEGAGGQVYFQFGEPLHGIYEMTTGNFAEAIYGRLKELKQKAELGQWTGDEEKDFQRYQSAIESMSPKVEYIQDEKAKKRFLLDKQLVEDIKEVKVDKYRRLS